MTTNKTYKANQFQRENAEGNNLNVVEFRGNDPANLADNPQRMWVNTASGLVKYSTDGFTTVELSKKSDIDALKAETTNYLDVSKENTTMTSIRKMLNDSRKQTLKNVTYIIVGDSTRASNGAWIYALMKERLAEYNVTVLMSAQSGLKAEHWGETTPNLQPGYPIASDIIPLIPTDGSTTIVDICLGINDIQTRTTAQVISYIQNGITKLKASRANVNIILTSPNERSDSTASANTKIVYDSLVSTYNYAYVNVLENVWKSWTEANNGFFLDTTHPNELGQRKMSDFIFSKILPRYTASILPYKIPMLKHMVEIINPTTGYVSKVFAAIKVLKGTNDLYLRKLTATGWYIFNTSEGNSCSVVIPNTGLSFLDKGFSTTSEVNAYVYVEDLDKLNELPIGTKVSVKKCVVSDFEFITNYAQIYTNTANSYMQKLVGAFDPTDPNYAAYKSAGVRVEFKYTGGTTITNLYFGKAGGAYYLYAAPTGGNSTSDKITANENGYIQLVKPSYGVTDFEGMLYISDISKLASMPDNTRIKLTNWSVTELSPRTTIRDYLMSL